MSSELVASLPVPINTSGVTVSGGNVPVATGNVPVDASISSAGAPSLSGAWFDAPPPNTWAVTKVAWALDNPIDAIGYGVSRLLSVCFSGETVVKTSRGDIPIRDIEAGDLVLSRDVNSGKTAWKRISRVFRKYSATLLDLEFVDDKNAFEIISATSDHPFWVKDRGWTPAKVLKTGDRVLSHQGIWLQLVSSRLKRTVQDVYNLEVEGYHTYFVGKLGAWVHNSCGAGGIPSVNELRNSAPIFIPDIASAKVQSKASGYDQVTFRWQASGLKYEARWHTPTPGAPVGSGPSWVVLRTTPGSPGVYKQQHVLTRTSEHAVRWVPAAQWFEAVKARQSGTATTQQEALLDSGHFR